ncbi:hypothetical protein ACQEU8_04045 [Streptomyces sp. CA-250714]|uniref:hypothetical protein n=1 Tax=Streptomyces sp. CA-250714 TaxID=3240060 RepID=UPI003D927AA4
MGRCVMAGCDFGFARPTVGGYCVGEGKGTSPQDLGDSAFDNIVDSAAEAAASTVKALGSAWASIESPDLGADSGPVEFLRGSTVWFTSFTAVLCLLIAAGHIAWQRRSEPGKQALQGLLNLVVVSSAGVAAANLLTVAGDRFSVWIIDRSTGCRQISPDGEPVEQCVSEFDKRVSAMLALGDADSSFLVLIMSVLVIAASVAQIALLIVRVALLVILAGTLPLSAAASSTPAGRAWFRKSVGWLLAFVLYKPAAAIVYAAAFSMPGTEGDGEGSEIISMVSGVVLLVLACFTLPALLRLAAPVAQTALSGTGRGSTSRADSGDRPSATGAQTVPQLRGLAAGRPVSGATLSMDRPEATGARGAPGSAAVRRPAHGAGGTPHVPPGGEHTTATIAERARHPHPSAVRNRPGEQPSAEQDGSGKELLPSAPATTRDRLATDGQTTDRQTTDLQTTHPHHDDQQRESRGSD